jgi:hypothetical protein
VKKSNSSVKTSNFGVKKILFFTLASMKKSRFGKEKRFILTTFRITKDQKHTKLAQTIYLGLDNHRL